MKYTIKVDGGFKILAINRWKGTADGDNLSYDIPLGVEEISETVYNELIARNDLNYIKWIDGNVVPETDEEKAIREAVREQTVVENDLTKIKELIQSLSPYVILTDAGNDLING